MGHSAKGVVWRDVQRATIRVLIVGEILRAVEAVTARG